MGKEENNGHKEGEDMSAILEKDNVKVDLKSALDKIASKVPVLKVRDGKIILDRNNEDHIDWFEDDGDN